MIIRTDLKVKPKFTIVFFQDVPRAASRSCAIRVCVPRNDGMEKGDAEKELPSLSEREEDDERSGTSRWESFLRKHASHEGQQCLVLCSL